MALTPLFITDVATVKARLRMTGVPAGEDADKMIEEALRTVRVGFYRRISATRIAQIGTYPTTENPTSETGILRQLAEVTELKWIRAELLRTIPTVFFDSIPSVQSAWNEEGMLRGSKPDEREYEIRRLLADVEQAMSVLEEAEEIPNETRANTAVYVSETPSPRPFGSVFGCPPPW